MKIMNIKDDEKYLKEYIELCSLEWGKEKSKSEMEKFISDKENEILTQDKVISILGLIDDNNMIGFISLFRYDDVEDCDLTPWYATMYVKKEYRSQGISKILNDAILKEAKRLGYKRIYLKSTLVNYYEKFGAKLIKKIDDEEKLYYIDL